MLRNKCIVDIDHFTVTEIFGTQKVGDGRVGELRERSLWNAGDLR